ncbi:MAG: geranylgeranylglyceryl/heptaprenylglyceryl phosphate synthase [Winogradskyella sp.]|uniref:geranylgeranylglyceryl/heptaprenylglyceryl phosphate synthase n=1 Tax=Winogradskyella sp. TaxID=1883156 RepID=UPI000F3CEE07|nr:geranylgeranylglyceryl/heptaprenylglyceryl phosphate synthase [Winogradskyella sp.]RNC87821.1 MAG: geranylgeranylglyceryl/heptaprenylglyceryl phosphate synthase [Winogradskyella sp.]
MTNLYQNILKSTGKKFLAVLIDPDKMRLEAVSEFISKVNQSVATHIFVGGSEVAETLTDNLVEEIKKHTALPVILFPGDVIQITDRADGLLFLSLISGRNSEYLIGKHVEAITKIQDTNLEVIPTGYILIENGKVTSVERVSKTKPIPRHEIQIITNTAIAGELLGMKLIYLEAGSGATHPIESEIISKVKNELDIPLIVGGGIRSVEALNSAYDAGADLVVIGTAFEEDENFFNELKK